MGYIYKITNKVNGKGYVGQTTWPIQKRWNQHIADATGNNKKKLYLIHHALLKYGVDNFNFNIVETIPDNKLDEREKYWIKFWHTCIYDSDCNGYNLTWGGQGTTVIDSKPILDLWNQGYTTTEISEKLNHSQITISAHLKMEGIAPVEILNRGYKKISEKNKKKVYQYTLQGEFVKEWPSIKDAAESLNTESTNLVAYLKNLYSSSRGRRSCGNYLWTEDPNDLEKALNKYNDNLFKKNRCVGQFDLNNNLIATFNSAEEAGRILGIWPSQIRNVCNNKPKYKTAKGYIWKYIDNKEDFKEKNSL